MVECTNTGNYRGVTQRLGQTGKSDHYGPWHSHNSAPQMGLYFGLVRHVASRALSVACSTVVEQSPDT